jgi:lipopolysaccharide/colanic/teichoic acid biosynthesis glycosyltransferase
MLLVLLSPLMLLIAVLIKLDTRGPVLFTQERVGTSRRSRNGRLSWEIRNFRMYKFRSMVHNADNSVHEAYIKAWVEGRAEAANEAGTKFKLTNDPRITRIGRIIRKTSLDELPQLFNVLKGEMSLVGPRPVPTYEVAQYEEWHCERLAALPGMTGLWQVRGRCQVPFEDQVRMDIEYVRSKSLWLDLQLLVLTIPAVLSGDGAE